MNQLQTVLDTLERYQTKRQDFDTFTEAIAIVKQMMQEEPIPVPDDIVAGALYDFLGYLTTRRTRITMSDRDEAGPAVDALVDWSKTRKINLVEARVRDWNAFTAPQAVRQVSWNLKYKDSTPKLNVMNSAFEDWYQQQPFATGPNKQLCRDSYAAGMGDPLVTYSNPQAVPADGLHGCACRWDKNDKRIETCVRHQGWLDVVSEWSDRAKNAEAVIAAALTEVLAQPVSQYTDIVSTGGMDPRNLAQQHNTDPSYTTVELAEMILSDCGCSSNNTSLVLRVANRIDAHMQSTQQVREQEFTGLPKRKLNDLLARGYKISGVSFQREQHGATWSRGFITYGGMVGWWHGEHEQMPQFRRDTLEEATQAAVDAVAFNGGTVQMEAHVRAAIKELIK